MKRSASYIIGIAAIAAVTLGSCKKYLEVEPISSFGPEFVFDNAINAEKAVLGAYAPMTGDQGYGIRLSMYYTYDDDLMMGQGGTPYPDNERRDIAHYNVNANNTQLAGPFNQLWLGVERANLCIYYIPRMPEYTGGTTAQQAKLKWLHGEALTLRAQYYLELIRNWGDLPVQLEPSFTQTDLYKGKTDRDSIYEVLLKDLQLAATLVPWRTQASASSERITQGAVRALRARIALYRAGYSLRRSPVQMVRGSDPNTYYQIAKDECNTIIQQTADHKLNPSFRSVFKDYICGHAIEPNGEILWEVAMGGGTSALGDSKLGYYNGPRGNGTSLGNSALTVLPSYFYMFDSTDLRRDVMCVPYNVTNAGGTLGSFRTLQTMVDGKFRRDWIAPNVNASAAQYFGLNWPVIRMSDVMLMYAEADNELGNGPSAAAYTAINQVRRRGHGKPVGTADPTIDLAGLNKAQFFDSLVKERALELGGEGIRKYDLIRWNLLGTKLAATKAQLQVMAARSAAPWNTYPTTMYFLNNSTTLTYAGSYYKPNVTPAPSGHSSVAWLGTAINTTIVTYYAAGFTANKSEILPIPQASIDANRNLKQDYGY